MPAEPELWLPVDGHEGYEVSDLGRVRNARTGHVLRASYNDSGYLKVCFNGGRGEGSQWYVHCLVAHVFLGPRPAGMDVHHIDYTRTNCALTNLMYRPIGDNRGDHKAGNRGSKFGTDR